MKPRWVFLSVLTLASTRCVAADDATPLLTYAGHQHFPAIAPDNDVSLRLARVTAELVKNPPPEADCAKTLGARRFAGSFDDLGGAYSDLGDEANAAAAFAKAIACNPRATFLHAELASALLNLGRYREARAQAEQTLASDRGDFALHTLLGQLDFIEERWPEAIAHFRSAVTEAPDDEQATYWQCFLWLAQKRAGTAEPTLASRRTADGWPHPILESLRGVLTEADLVDDIQAQPDIKRRREMLAEALYYRGQQALATHRPDDARRYFAATVDLKVLYFIEHPLAAAELAKSPVRRPTP